MNKTAIIYSREEALKMPLRERPLCFRIPEKVYTAIWESIGSASMCWKPRPGNQVFHSEMASDVATQLCLTIADAMDDLREVKNETNHEQIPHPNPR